MSHSAAGDSWDIVRYVYDNHDELKDAWDGPLPAYYTIRKRIDATLPAMTFDYACKDKVTEEIRTVSDAKIIKTRKSSEEKMYECGVIAVSINEVTTSVLMHDFMFAFF